jgi:thioredoxin-like negative regulator of GroEL
MTAIEDAVSAPASNDQPPQQPKLVLIYSPRSGRSRRVDGYLAQVLQRRSNHDTFKLLRVNADERPDLVERLRVTEIPSLLVIDGRRVRARLGTPRGCTEIQTMLKPWLK